MTPSGRIASSPGPMLPTHHLLQLVPNRARSVLERMRARTWSDLGPVDGEATAAGPTFLTWTEARRRPRKPIVPGETWGRLFDQRWVKLALPPAAGGRYLEWRDEGEATLYLNGEPWFGYDVAHRRVALPRGVREAWIESTCCQSAIWHPTATGLGPDGSRCFGAYLSARDEAGWRLANDFQILLDLARLESGRQPSANAPAPAIFGRQPPLEKATPLYRQLLRWLDRICDAFDADGPGTAGKIVDAAFADLIETRPRLRAVLVGHAHIDLVWLWPEAIGEAKAVHTFATVDRLMHRYPELRFACGQPASYAAVARRAPRLFRRIAKRIHSGQWQPTGTMYVESDTLLPCGEALARSFTIGQTEFSRLREGRPARILWLPDVFGYAGCVPQLMKLSGVSYFFTTKLTWSAVNRFPYSSFVWRGTDGSEVLAHVTQEVGYNNQLDLSELNAAEQGHAQADVHREFLHPVGFGDGGGGPTEEMCERARRIGRLTGLPASGWETPEAFFDRMAAVRRDLPAYQGELYLEYHRGTYTTHAALKAAFRELECALRTREAVAVALGRCPDLGAPWRRLVFAQFHDCVPGTSVPEVYDEIVPELARLAAEQRQSAERDLALEGGKRCWFNPLPVPWTGWVDAPGGRRLVQLPPVSGVAWEAAARPTPAAPRVGARRVVTDRIDLRLDERGRMARLIIDGRPVDFASPGAELVLYPDRPAAFEAWDIDRQALSLGVPISGRAVIRSLREEGRGILVVERPIGAASRAVLRYIVESGQPVVRIEIDLAWHEEQMLLKLRFPTRYTGMHARFGAPFGSVRRGQWAGPLVNEAQWEVPGSRYAAVADESEADGLVVLAESKYGYSARDGELAVTLVRSPHQTGHDAQHAAASPRGLSRLKSAPFTDQGMHHVRLAIGRFSADAARAEQPAALAETVFAAPLPYRGKPVGSAFLGLDGGESLQPAWALPLDGRRWILRLHEVFGRRGSAVLRLAPGYHARKVDLLGRPLTDWLVRNRIEFGPAEIVSLLIAPV